MPRRNTPNPGENEPQQPAAAPRDAAPAAPVGGAREPEPATDALHIVREQGQQPKPARIPQIPRPASAKKAATPAAAPLGRRAKPEEPAAGSVSNESLPDSGAKKPLRERAKQKQNERRREDRAKFSMAVRRKPGQKPEPAQPVDPGQPVAAHRFSGRIAALIVVFGFFAVMLVPTVNYYRTQMTEISELRASIASMEAQRDDLKAEIARWDDPLYIKQQARERINLVMPGEKLYMVVGQKPEDQGAAGGNGSTYEVRQELPWVDALIDSVHRSATD